MMFGNQDKDKLHEFPADLAKEGQVVVFQQFLIEKPGQPWGTAPHPTPIQTYPLKRFQDQYATPPGQKQNGFFQLGLLVEPLHIPEDGLEPDEDFDLPEGPIADTAPGSAAEIVKAAAEAVANGTALTDAELLHHRGAVRDQESGASGESEENAEAKLAEQAQESKKLGDAATAESVAKATEHAQATGDAPVIPVKPLSAAQKAAQAKKEKDAAKASGK